MNWTDEEEMKAKQQSRKEVLAVLFEKFGACGCKDRCAWEEYPAEEAGDYKPNGRYTVCPLDAERCGLDLPEKAEEE